MKYLDVSNNNFGTFPNYLKCGIRLPNVILLVEYLDASNCGIKCASKDLLGNCTCSLKFVNASHNEFGRLEGGCNKRSQK